MTVLFVLAATALFFIALTFSGVIELSYHVFAESGSAMKVMGDSSLDDDAKEAAMQKQAVAMFKLFGQVLVRVVAILAAPLLLLTLAVFAGWTSEEGLIAVSLSWPFIALNIAAFVGVLIWQKKR